MKVTLHLEMDEGDYIGILKVASIKGQPTEQLIMTAIREYITKEIQSIQSILNQEVNRERGSKENIDS